MLRSALASMAALALASAAAAASAQGMAAVRQACQADFQKLCKDLQPGERPGQCLRQHKDALSGECRSAIAQAMAARRAAKADGTAGGGT